MRRRGSRSMNMIGKEEKVDDMKRRRVRRKRKKINTGKMIRSKGGGEIERIEHKEESDG